MKAAFVLAIFAYFVAMITASCVYSETAGQPLCTADNFKTQKFRNNWDPTSYWQCNAANNQPAEAVSCDGEGYVAADFTCQPWTQWTWTAPCDPPSMYIA